jgi:NAD(P)-dependent dehydrogenase (short-subunit alcohol dehydrogenase family)
MSKGKLEGRVILITGATGTLGTAASRAAARQGAHVVLLGRTISKLEKLYDAIVAHGGPVPAIYPLDLMGASEQDYADLATTLEHDMGGLDGVLHCAAELGHLAPLAEQDGQRWQRLLHINLTAPCLLTRAIIPLLLRAKQGTAVFVGDSAVADGKAYWGAYGVAKIGLAGYARILNEELEAFGVRSQLFTPGPMRSPIRLRAYTGESAELLPSVEQPAERIVELLIPASTPTYP